MGATEAGKSTLLQALTGVICLLYTSDAADERSSVDLGGRRIIEKTLEHAASGRHGHADTAETHHLQRLYGTEHDTRLLSSCES